MAEVSKTYQRGLTRILTTLRRPDQNLAAIDSEGDTDSDVDAVGSSTSRRLDFLRNRAKQKSGASEENILQKQAEEKLKKEIAQKLSWRAVNIATGASIILIFVTILIWTIQFIGGNMMGSKMIPKLGIGETILWIIGLVVIAVLWNMILLGITLLIQVFEDPGGLIGSIISIFWNNFWSGLLGR